MHSRCSSKLHTKSRSSVIKGNIPIIISYFSSGRLSKIDPLNRALFCGSILDWRPDEKYDIIICSLPFNTFEPDFVSKVLEHLEHLAKPGCILSYVELMWITTIKQVFLTREQRIKLDQTRALMRSLLSMKGIGTGRVYLNVTPIYIHHIALT